MKRAVQQLAKEEKEIRVKREPQSEKKTRVAREQEEHENQLNLPDFESQSNDTEVSLNSEDVVDVAVECEVQESPYDGGCVGEEHKTNLNKTRTFHNRENNKVKFSCKLCSSTFCRKDNVKRHMCLVHGVNVSRLDDAEKKTACFHPGCNAEFYHKTKLIKHIEEVHSIPFETQNLTFSTHDDFLRWKEQEEQDNFVYFSKSSGMRQGKKASYVYYQCQKDGSPRSHRKSTEPERKTARRNKKGLCKSKRMCPARMQVKLEGTGVVCVNYVKTHSHPVQFEDTAHHPTPNEVKEEIRSKLLLGVSADDIQKSLREGLADRGNRGEGSSRKKRHLVSKRLIESIRGKLKVNELQGKHASLSLNDKIERLQQEKYNPVLLYKPEGPSLNGGPDIVVSTQLTSNLILLAVQTKEQREVLEKYGGRLLYIDKTHKLGKSDFSVVSLIVLDEYAKGYPVAYLIANFVNKQVLVTFFQSVKDRSSSDLNINTVMTYDSDNVQEAVRIAFGKNVQHLVCKWHLQNSWMNCVSKHVENQEIQQKLQYCMLAMLEETDVDKFEHMCALFALNLKARFPGLIQQFMDSYVPRAREWAVCFRGNIAEDVHHGAFLEAFHKRIDPVYARSKKNRNIDGLLPLLLAFEEEDYYRRKKAVAIADHISVSASTRHEMGIQIDDSCVSTICHSAWAVQAQSDQGKMYTVSKKDQYCEIDSCFESCLAPPCHTLCGHLYTCTCDDSSSLCEHIHKVHSLVMTECMLFDANLEWILNFMSNGGSNSDKNDDEVTQGCDDEEEEDNVDGSQSFLDGNSFHFFTIMPGNSTGESDGTGDAVLLERIQQNLNNVVSYLENENVRRLALPHVDLVLQQLVQECSSIASLEDSYTNDSILSRRVSK